MRTTVDKAGRVVLPKNLRLEVGLMPGEVEIVVEGSSLRISPVSRDTLEEVDGLLMLPEAEAMSPDDVRDLRLADQR
jgi:AbrB family looped-hinge helix DNA binding protein